MKCLPLALLAFQKFSLDPKSIAWVQVLIRGTSKCFYVSFLCNSYTIVHVLEACRCFPLFLITHWLLCHCSWILIVCFTSCTRLRATWISAKKCREVGCSFVRYRPVQVFGMCLSKRSPCYCIRWKHQQSTNDIVCVAGMTFKPFTGSFFCRVEFAGYLPMD